MEVPGDAPEERTPRPTGASRVPDSWRQEPEAGLRRYFPVVGWLSRYSKQALVFDVVAGITVWGILVPEGMGYADIAGMPLQAGLYTLLGSLIVYAIFGTSKQLAVGATAASASITASVVIGVHATNASDYAAAVGIVVLATGALFLLFGLLRLGFVVVFIPRPVMSGFVFGLGVFIITKQVYKILGVPKPTGTSSVDLLVEDASNLGKISVATLAVGGGFLLALFVVRKLAPKVPGPLLALAVGIALSAVFDLDAHGVATVGEVPSGLPSFEVPSVPWGEVLPLVVGSLGLMLVILSESLGAAETIAERHGYSVDPNQEMVAQGFTNLTSGLLGGLANGGSMSSSSVNDAAGARTPISTVIAWVLVLATAVLLTPLFTDLPEAVLGAIVIYAVAGLIRVKEFVRFWRIDRVGFGLGVATLLLVVTWDVLPAMILGVVLSAIAHTAVGARARVAVLARRPDAPEVWGSITAHHDWETVPGIIVLGAENSLFYANGSAYVKEAQRLIALADPPPDAVVLEIEPRRIMDITGIEYFRRLVVALREVGIRVALVSPTAEWELARRPERLPELDDVAVYPTVAHAVAEIRRAAMDDDGR